MNTANCKHYRLLEEVIGRAKADGALVSVELN